MTVLANSYFSGAGLIEIGLRRAGVQLQQSFEIDPICSATHRLNFKHEMITGDICKKLVKSDKPCHAKIFTFPCNNYSPIADIHESRTGDELFLHSLRHMVIQPPELFAVENVPGMKKFPVVMEVMTGLPDYYVTVFCPVSAQMWLPQKRDRLIVIGSRRPFSFRPPQNRKPRTLAHIIERDPEVNIPKSVYSRMRGKYRDLPIISDPRRGDLAPCCVAHYSKDLSTRLVRDKRFKMGVRPYTVREYARLQGVPDSFQFAGTPAQQYRQIGNGVAEPMGHWLGCEIMRYFGEDAA